MSINTIGMGSNSAMDGRAVFDYLAATRGVKLPAETVQTTGGSQESESAAKKIEASVSPPLIKKLRYNVNEQLDQVVVTVVDASTDRVIKEIPSAEVQEMRVRVKNAIGSFIDETR